ncbi:MAG: hypothetical protein RL230_3098 [Pseudomonadota bacterium]
MKELCVARLALIKDRTAAPNRKHARSSQLLTQINKQFGEIDAAIAAIIATQLDLKGKFQALTKLGKPAKKAIIAVLRKLIVLANALLSMRKLWTPNPA